MPLAQYMHHALGSDHAVTVMLQRLADANLSSATKRKQQEEQKLLEVGTWLTHCRTLLCGGWIAKHTFAISHCAIHVQMVVPSCPIPSPPPSLGSAVLLRGRGGGGLPRATSYVSCSTVLFLLFLLVCPNSAPLVPS